MTDSDQPPSPRPHGDLTIEPPPPGRTRYTTAASVWEVDSDACTIAHWPRGYPSAVPYWSVGRPEPYHACVVRHRDGRPSSLRGVTTAGVPFQSGRIVAADPVTPDQEAP